MAKIVLNKNVFENAKSVEIKVLVDGEEVDIGPIPDHIIEVQVTEGTIENLTVEGAVKAGCVRGNISARGGVDCDCVGGDVNAGGNVRCGRIGGSVTAKGGVRHA